MFIALAIIFISCNQENIEKYAYQTLNISSAVYNLAKSATIDLYKSGYLNDDQKMQAIKLSNQYNDAYQLAVAALDAYKQTADSVNKEILEKTLVGVADTLMDLTKYLEPYIKKREGG